MKKTNFHFRAFVSLWTLLLFIAPPSKAQIPPSTPDIFLSSSISNIAPTINCDMLAMPAYGDILRVIAWNSSNGVDVEISDNISTSVTLSIPNGFMPDVVLADDYVSPGTDYILAIVYRDLASMQAILETYRISGIGSALTLTPDNAITLGNPGQYFPHIDMIADLTAPISGHPAMNDFVVSWDEDIMGGQELYAGYGSISNLSGMSSLMVMSASAGILHDIAASMDIAAGGAPMAYIVAEDGSNPNNLDVYHLDCASMSFSAVDNYSLPGASYIPRIEAVGGYEPSVFQTPYSVVSTIMNFPVPAEVWEFNMTNMPGGINVSAALGGTDNWMAAVGIGCFEPAVPFGYSDFNYTIAWYMQGGRYIAQATDAFTGAASIPFAGDYQVNSAGVNPNLPGKIPVAVSGCSNTSGELLTAWYDDLGMGGNIWYKYTGAINAYKPGNPTAIKTINESGYSVYPSPAANTLHTKGFEDVDYTITDISGKIIRSSRLDKGVLSIDITSLQPGIYLLNFRKEGHNHALKFVKM